MNCSILKRKKNDKKEVKKGLKYLIKRNLKNRNQKF